MAQKIHSDSTLVILHGDEMAQVAFEKILDLFVKKRLDIKLCEIDLSAENRLRTNGKVVQESIEALKKYRTGIKNAGITVNKQQLKDFIAALNKKGAKIDEKNLAPLATKSPNGAIRKGIGGNIMREDIPFRNLKRQVPQWIGRDIDVMTMEGGGLKDSFNMISSLEGELKLQFMGKDKKLRELHARPIRRDGILLVATNSVADVKKWAHQFFSRALKEKRDAYVGLKDTVIPGYDGVMKDAVEAVFKKDFAAKFAKAKLKYTYGLIDAQAAQIIVNPPTRALWGIPDNTTGRKMYKLVEELKKYGLPERSFQTTVARMSAGGGDQYGSYNAPADADGTLMVTLNGEIKHMREVKKGDPVILMTNVREDIRAWVNQVFEDAERHGREIYFGLKREYMLYDAMFSDVIRQVRDERSQGGRTPPAFMIMRPSNQIIKMLVDPPRNATFASLNLDGDIYSDIAAALGGSLATASSIIASPDGITLLEAPHGTAPDLYKKYVESKGKVALFNPSALIFAVANAIDLIGARERDAALTAYARALKEALIETVAQGIITADIKGKTAEPKKEKLTDLYGFLDAVEKNLDKLIGKTTTKKKKAA